jgi:hypothetical protein
MTPDVPSRRSVDSFKKEAKRWLQALHAQDPAARARFAHAHPDAGPKPGLREVQYAIAREHGFGSWAELKNAIDQHDAATEDARARALAHYQAAADALLDAYRTGTPDVMARHYAYTWHQRAWSAMRTYVQLDLGKRPAHPGDDVEITIDDARRLVALEYGFKDWTDLEARTRSLTAHQRVLAKPLAIVRQVVSDDWEQIAASRDWDEILELLARHPDAGLSGQGQLTDELLADLARVEGLKALNLQGCSAITDAGVKHIGRLRALEGLNLSGVDVTDDGLRALRDLPKLRMLTLGWNGVTSAGVEVLRHLPALEHLTVRTPGLGDAVIRAMAGHAALRRLEVVATDDGLAALHAIPAFKTWHGGPVELGILVRKVLPNHLWLRGDITDRGVRHLAGLDGLFSLDIEDEHLPLTAECLEPLVSLPHLGVLAVDPKDDWMPRLAAMANLRFLMAQDTTAGDDGFEALSRSQSIEYIWGRRCHNLRTRGFRALATMPALRGLSVSCLNVDDSGLAALPSFPALRQLMPMDVPDAGYRHIGRCEALESLLLMYCRNTTDAATEHVAGLRKMSRYFNSYTTITDRTPELLSTMDSLETVTFDACHGLTNDGVARLARLPKLRAVRASGRQISADVRSAFGPGVTVEVSG